MSMKQTMWRTGQRKPDEKPNHADERRTIEVVFNNVNLVIVPKKHYRERGFEGDDLDSFTAQRVVYAANDSDDPLKGDVALSGRGRAFFYVPFSSRQEVLLYPDKKAAVQEIGQGQWFFMDSGVEYDLIIPKHACVVACEENMQRIRRNSRSIVTVLNGEFPAAQVKILTMLGDSWLGGQNGHSHDYAEAYAVRGDVSGGSAGFFLMEGEKVEAYSLYEQNQLVIPAKTPHKALVKCGSVLIGATEWPYLSPQINDKPYEGTWPC